MTPEIRALISGVIFMTKYTKGKRPIARYLLPAGQ